jgi:hypothetical protein
MAAVACRRASTSSPNRSATSRPAVCKRVIERLADRCGSSGDDAGVALERVTHAVVVIAQEPADFVESDEGVVAEREPTPGLEPGTPSLRDPLWRSDLPQQNQIRTG